MERVHGQALWVHSDGFTFLRPAPNHIQVVRLFLGCNPGNKWTAVPSNGNCRARDFELMAFPWVGDLRARTEGEPSGLPRGWHEE